MKTGILSLIILIQLSVSSFAITKNWVGAGASTGTSDWNTSSNWNPSGIPGSADDVVIAMTGAGAYTITFSGSPATITINSLSFSISGNNKSGKIDIGGNTVIISSTATFNVPSGNSNTILQVGVNGGTSAGVIDFGGTVTMSTTSNGVVEFIGNANSKLIFRNNLTFGPVGAINSTNIPGSSEFVSATSQIVTFNSNVGNFNNVTIGTGTNNPIVTFAGSSNAGLTGNLTINGSSVLDLDTRTFNRSTSGGTLSLNSTSQLKLSNSNGGVSGSNFPNNFSTINLSSASTVEYNAAGGTNQTIYATPAYGNLILSRLSGATNTNKSATANVTVKGNLTISSGATFDAGNSLTHTLSGDFTNNGSFSYNSSSTINFTGSNSATVNGASTTAFNNIIINKGSNINSILVVVSPMSMNGNLTLTNGLFKMSNASASVQFGTSSTIASTSGIELNSGTINANNVTVTNNGMFKITGGTANIGNSSGNSLNTSATGTFSQSEGTLNIAGRMTFTGGIMNVTGGIINIGTFGNNSTSASLDLDGSSELNASGGTIKISSANSGSGYDLRILSGAGSKLISGGSIQIGNGSSESFKINSTIPVHNFELNSTGDATLISSLSINNTLTFTSGKITTGSNKVIMSTSSSVNGAGNGKYVNGSLEKFIPASATTVTFEIGTPPSYAPVVLNFNGTTNGTGSITAKSTSSDHPGIANSGINSSKSINRYWSLINNGVSEFTSYDATFTFNYPSDVDGGTNTSAIVVRRMNGSTWYASNTGATSSTSAQGLSMTDFGDFQIGETTGLPTVNCSSMNITSASCSEVVNFSSSSTGFPAPVITYSHNPGTSFNIGTTPVIVTATNINGSVNCSFDVKLTETEAPVFQNFPADLTVTPTSNCEAAASWTLPTVTDNCSFTLTSNFNPGDNFAIGTHQVTYTAIDASGNSVSRSFNVIVADNEAPVINCPSDIIINAPGSCGSNVNFSVSATDNCSMNLSTSHASGSFFPIGNTTVTSTAIDAFGNTTSCAFHVIVNDNELPVLNVPSNITVSAPVGSCGKSVAFNVTATDNCSAAVVTTPSSGSFFPIGTTSVVSTATDNAGNLTTRSFNVIVADNEFPVINGPADISVNAENNLCGAVVNYNVTTTDNCSATISTTPASGSLFPIGTTTVYSVASDGVGNTTTRSFNVTVIDNVAPAIDCPPTVIVDAGPNEDSVIVNFTVTVTDDCAATLSIDEPSGSYFPIGMTLVTCTATDASGNTSTCSFHVKVNDNTAPHIYCPADITINATPGQSNAPVSFVVTTTDNQPVNIFSTPSSGSLFPVGTTIVNTIGTDPSGNASTCTFSVTVVDNESPVLSVPADISVNADAGSCGAIVNFNVTTTDNTYSTVISVPASGSVFPIGTTTVHSIATDGSGNSASRTFDITVIDNEIPVINCLSSMTINSDSHSCGAIVNFNVPASDNCSATVTSTPASGSYFPIGTTTVTSIAADASGTLVCTFEVTVIDNELPVINNPADISVNTESNLCGAEVNFNVTASDNCSATISTAPSSGSFFPIGTTTVYSVATDGVGNTTSSSFNVTVIDNEAPTIDCPSTVLVDVAANEDSAVVNFDVTVTDNCSATLTTSPQSGSAFAIGMTLVTCTATDASGNTSTCSFHVKVKDDHAPNIYCPADITINALTGDCNAAVNFDITQIDNQPADIISTPSSGSTFPVGTTIVNTIATDPSGNSATCSFSVTVVDAEFPILSVPANISVNAADGSCGEIVNFNVTATDNCSATVSTIPESGSFFSIGTTTVTAIATDLSGNETRNTFDVTVIDNQSPVITCISDINTTTDLGVNGASVNFNVIATDNCSVIVNSTPASGSLFPIGTTTVTSEATDASGNTVSCSFNVTVSDNESPVINCPASIQKNNDHGMCGAMVNFNVSATDNSSATVQSSHASGSFFPIGTTTVTSTATDLAGNISTCNFDVTVADSEFPLLQMPSSVNKYISAGKCNATVTFNVTGTDNCSATVQTNPASGSTFLIGTTMVKAIATDASGNITIDSFPVYVIDTIRPVINCHSNMSVNATSGLCGAVVSFAVTASDNCSATVTTVPASGSLFPIGRTVVKCTSFDSSGNKDSCSFEVTVVDNIAPVFTNCPANIVVNLGSSSSASVTWASPVATDNCSATLTSSHASGSTFPLGLTTVTYTAIDPSGNTSTCSFNVNVKDNIPPSFTNCPSNITVNTNGSCDQVVSWTPPTATDNVSYVITSNHTPGQHFPVGMTVVTYKVTDSSGNIATCSFTVKVEDHEIPVITNCPADIIVIGNSSTHSANVTWTAPTVIENCSYTFGCNKTSGAAFNDGTTLVIYTVTDASGNTATCSFTVTVTSITSVNEISFEDRIVAYPNPMTSVLNLNIKGASMAKTYKVISMLGAVVLSGDVNGFEASIGVESLTAGTYIVEIVLADGERFFKNVVRQ